MTRQEKLAMLGAAIGNGIFGFSFMFSRVALNAAAPTVMLMHRFLLAAAVLLAIALVSRWRGVETDAQGGIHFLRFSLRGKPIWPLLLLGVVQPVIYFLCESYGISMTNATFSGVVIALMPIVALGMGAVLLGEMPRRAQIFWSVLSIAGVILMTIQQHAEGEIQPLGVVMLIGAVLSSVLFNILSRRISGQYSALERTLVMMLVASAAFTCMAAVQCRGDLLQMLAPLGDASFVLSIAYLSVASSVIAFLCINYANNTLPVARTTAFCNLTTAISVFAGAVFLGEPFGMLSLIAAVMIIVGVWKVQQA